VAKLIEVANASADIPFAVVGSEAILRFEKGWPDGLAKAQLLALIDRVKQQVSVPVTTAEPWHVWRDHPDLAAAVDLLFVNVHPCWEGQGVDTAVSWVGQRYAELRQRYPTKRIVVSETGWPTCGSAQGAAAPSIANQERFLTELLAWPKGRGSSSTTPWPHMPTSPWVSLRSLLPNYCTASTARQRQHKGTAGKRSSNGSSPCFLSSPSTC